jgi:hypothetical protein
LRVEGLRVNGLRNVGLRNVGLAVVGIIVVGSILVGESMLGESMVGESIVVVFVGLDVGLEVGFKNMIIVNKEEGVALTVGVEKGYVQFSSKNPPLVSAEPQPLPFSKT